MKRTSFSLIALLVLAVLVTALTGCGGRRTIVKVNGVKFTKNDFYDRLQKVPVQTAQGPQMAGRFVMQQMITETLIQQLAKKEGVEPKEAQINKKIDRFRKEAGPNFAKVLAAQGMSMDDLKRQVSVQQALINVVTKGITVSDAEVKKAYDDALKQTPSPFIRPEAVTVSGIIMKDKAKIDKAYSLVQGGTDFGTVAMQYNDDPVIKKNQGRLPALITREDPRIPPIIRNTAFALQPGKFSKPLSLQGTWLILKVETKRPKRITSFADAKDIVWENLAVQRGNAKGNFAKAMKPFAKNADIFIGNQAYKDIADLIKKQAAEAPPTPGMPGATGTPVAQPAAAKP